MLTEREKQLIECIRSHVTSDDQTLAAIGEFVLGLDDQPEEIEHIEEDEAVVADDTQLIDMIDHHGLSVYHLGGRWNVAVPSGGFLAVDVGDLRETLRIAQKTFGVASR